MFNKWQTYVGFQFTTVLLIALSGCADSSSPLSKRKLARFLQESEGTHSPAQNPEKSGVAEEAHFPPGAVTKTEHSEHSAADALNGKTTHAARENIESRHPASETGLVVEHPAGKLPKSYGKMGRSLIEHVERMEVPAAMASGARDLAAYSDFAHDKNFCSVLEYPGQGSAAAPLAQAQWDQIHKAFQDARGELLSWLRTNKKRFDSDTSKFLEEKLRNVKLLQPKKDDSPDLAWRGITMLGQAKDGNFQVEVGGGFYKLLANHPGRARFEMARTLAKAWSPCEMARLKAPQPWDAFLRCMKMDEKQQCGEGAYTEAGWAVATAIAREVAPPGCKIPAFSDKEASECTKRFLLPLTLISKKMGEK